MENNLMQFDKTRVITGAIYFILVSACLLLSSFWPFLALIFAACLLVFSLLELRKQSAFKLLPGLIYCELLILLVAAIPWPRLSFLQLLLGLSLAAALLVFFLPFFRLGENAWTLEETNPASARSTFKLALRSVLTIFWFLIPLAAIYYFASVKAHASAILYLLFATAWISDTAAYALGKRFGRSKLCPALSPKKTLFGFLSGVICTALFYFVWALIFPGLGRNLWTALGLGILLSVVGQAGDLFASLLKRYLGIKDYSHLFPGHGGLIDRLDSTYFILLAALLLRYPLLSTFR